MLAPIPCHPIEQHDTDVDAPREKRARIRAKLAAVREDHGVAEVRALPRKPVMHGSPVTPEEALKHGSLAKVRVREALVKVQHSFKEEAKELPPQPKSFVVPEVRIAWLRSTDREQRVIRYGADGFHVRGEADGGANVVRASVKNAVVSLGIDGLIFSVAVNAGDRPEDTLDKLVARLEPFYEIERVDPRTARICSPR